MQLLTRPVRGVRTPMRLTAPIHGVTFSVPGPRTVFSILDCRLALALADTARLLGELSIARVIVDNMYRPGARVRGGDKPSQHARALAVDILDIERNDGSVLDIETDWQGRIGAPPCGPTAALTPSADSALALRNAICAIARARLFHHVITPNRDLRHRDHVHLDLEPGVETSLLE